MFERFSAAARQSVVLAQEEARLLGHHYIGTEHLLLGLLHSPPPGVARALPGVTLERARDQVQGLVGTGAGQVSGHIPFTPRAKKVLELALREALAHKNNYIGPEHLLLGLVREGEGAGVQVLVALGGDLDAVRQAVLAGLPPGPDPGAAGRRRRWRHQGAGHSQVVIATAAGTPELRTTRGADAQLAAAQALAGESPVGSQHLLLALLGDPDSAAAKALAGLGVDFDRARELAAAVDLRGTSDEAPEEAGRRQTVLRLSDTTVVVESTDPVLRARARGVLSAAGAATTLAGDTPAGAGLARVWLALHDSLGELAEGGPAG